MEFQKYRNEGAYHWDATSSSIFKHVAFTAGRYEAIMKQHVSWKNSRVLDIACGDARITAYAAEAGARFVVGADLSMVGMTVGYERWHLEQPHTIQRAHFIQTDGLSLSVVSESFDIVIASEIIEHVEDPRLFLKEATRPLSKNGVLILTTPFRLTEKPLDPYHVHEYFPGELEILMRNFFDEVETTLTHPTWITSLYTMQSKINFFRLLINILSIRGKNPFLTWPIGRYVSQITIIGKGKKEQ